MSFRGYHFTMITCERLIPHAFAHRVNLSPLSLSHLHLLLQAGIAHAADGQWPQAVAKHDARWHVGQLLALSELCQFNASVCPMLPEHTVCHEHISRDEWALVHLNQSVSCMISETKYALVLHCYKNLL